MEYIRLNTKEPEFEKEKIFTTGPSYKPLTAGPLTGGGTPTGRLPVPSPLFPKVLLKGMIPIHSFKNIILMYFEGGICGVLHRKIVSGSQNHDFGMFFDV